MKIHLAWEKVGLFQREFVFTSVSHLGTPSLGYFKLNSWLVGFFGPCYNVNSGCQTV